METFQASRTIVRLAGMAALVLMWFLYAGKVNEQEIVLGGICLVLTALWLVAVSKQRFAPFAPKAGWLAHALPVPVQVVKDAATVIAALPRGIAGGGAPVGKVSSAPFKPGGDDPASSARRALAVGLTSVAPNSVVLDVYSEQKTIIYHELVPQGTTPEPAKSLAAE